MDKTAVYYGYDQANVAENGHPIRTVGVEQNFLFPTIHAPRNKARRIEISMAETELQKQMLLLVKNVTGTYYTIQFLQAKIKHYQKMDSLYSVLNTGAETRYKLGDISQLDWMNAQAKKQQVSLELNQINYDIQNMYRAMNALMQTNETYAVASDEMSVISVVEPDFQQNADVQLLRLQSDYIKANVKTEQQRLLPDISLGYFYGNNRFENNRGYHGFQVGLGIPLYAGEQNAKIKAGKIAANTTELLLQNDLLLLETKYNSLKNELNKYRDAIEFYNNKGKKLSDEIIRAATGSYQAGEIDFYPFVMSVENAMKITLDYYQSVLNYNKTALEINYLVK